MIYCQAVAVLHDTFSRSDWEALLIHESGLSKMLFGRQQELLLLLL